MQASGACRCQRHRRSQLPLSSPLSSCRHPLFRPPPSWQSPVSGVKRSDHRVPGASLETPIAHVSRGLLNLIQSSHCTSKPYIGGLYLKTAPCRITFFSISRCLSSVPVCNAPYQPEDVNSTSPFFDSRRSLRTNRMLDLTMRLSRPNQIVPHDLGILAQYRDDCNAAGFLVTAENNLHTPTFMSHACSGL